MLSATKGTLSASPKLELSVFTVLVLILRRPWNQERSYCCLNNLYYFVYTKFFQQCPYMVNVIVIDLAKTNGFDEVFIEDGRIDECVQQIL